MLRRLQAWRGRRAKLRFIAPMPNEIHHIGTDGEGNQIATVTKFNGEAVTVSLPPDYHPGQDGGALIFRKVAPEFVERHPEVFPEPDEEEE